MALYILCNPCYTLFCFLFYTFVCYKQEKMNIFPNILKTVGNTPLVALQQYSQKKRLVSTVIAKVEAFNPGGSAKDRVAVQMLLQAKAEGLLQPGGTIIEPTSGNTGVGLAMASAVLGYKLILTMPDTMSIERIKLAQAYGAQVILTPGALGMKGAIEKAQALLQEIPGAWMAGQFTNPANPTAHYLTTGPEIWRDTQGNVDIFVAGIGTGGTISGVGLSLHPVLRLCPLAAPTVNAEQTSDTSLCESQTRETW